MSNSANRLTFQRVCRLFYPQRSTHCLILSRRPGIKQSLIRQMSHNETSKSIAQRSRYSGILSTSSQWSKVIQGHVSMPSSFAESVTVCRSYSSVEHGCSQNFSTSFNKAENGQMGDIEANSASVPNDTWTAESCELYKRLTSDLLENGDWCEHKPSLYKGERRLFTKALVTEYPGKFFEYAFIFSRMEQRLQGVIQFGPYTQGPPGCVHGGASAAMMDSAIGVCVNRSFSHCVTASLSMNYKSFLPLGCTTLVESWVEKVEGRKIFASAELKSPDGKLTYITANALFIQLEPQGKSSDVVDGMQKQWGKRD